MVKFNYFILMIFILCHCSIDTKSGLWENKKFKEEQNEISNINFNKELTFDNFKKNVVLFGKKSNYPNLLIK
tara:strand:- start:32 stop:247 length:216 start_codon:yes stop_codon:yes gene_type:complete